MIKFFLFIVFFVLNTLSANEWNKLLHFKNSENTITSEEFFLSASVNPKPKDELAQMTRLLQGDDFEKIVCNFPARYLYLKENNKKIKNYNLEKCKELNEFYKSFGKDKVSIVFSSEYTNNPSSAFGHTMLLFSNENEDIEVSDAVHFSAKTDKDDGFFKYSYKGFTGEYEAYFVREPFFKKIYEYNTLEQRYMYIYNLDFTKEEIKKLIYHLFELRKATFKYYFLDGNCATNTTDILDVLTENSIDKEDIYYLPYEVLKDKEKNILKVEKKIPLLNKIVLLIDKMNENEKRVFFEIIENDKVIIDQNLSNIVKEALSYYVTFNFRRFHKVSKNYDDIMSMKYVKTKIDDESFHVLNKEKPSKISIGTFKSGNQNYFKFQYRPLFLDINDIQINNIQQSEVKVSTFDFLISEDIKLEKYDLLSLKSYPTDLGFYKPMSWGIHSSLNRFNKKNRLKLNNEVGFGRSYLIENKILFSFLAKIGLDNEKLYLKPLFNITSNINENMKVGFKAYSKYFAHETYSNKSAYLKFKNGDYNYSLEYENSSSYEMNEKVIFSISYNF